MRLFTRYLLQGYTDPFIRHRLTAAISFYCFQKRYSGPILPVIFYTESAYFKAALPLVMEDGDGSYGIRGQLKEIVLEGLKEEELLDIDSRLRAWSHWFFGLVNFS